MYNPISTCNRPLSRLSSLVGISRPLTFPPCSLLRSPPGFRSLLSSALIAWLTSPLLCCNALLAWEAEKPISTILAISLSWPTCNTVKQWRMLHVRVLLWQHIDVHSSSCKCIYFQIHVMLVCNLIIDKNVNSVGLQYVNQ